MNNLNINDFHLFLCDYNSQIKNNLRDWDYLYDYVKAEICDTVKYSIEEKYGIDLSEVNSLFFHIPCSYNCCINLYHESSKKTIHMCDFIPVVIGSNLDKRIRNKFWKYSSDIEKRDDILRTSLLFIKYNYFHLSTIMVINSKLCHVSPSDKEIRVRHYLYDELQRGHMFYLKQYQMYEPNSNEFKVVEVLILRNCIGFEYYLVHRICTRCKIPVLLKNYKIYCSCSYETVNEEIFLNSENIYFENLSVVKQLILKSFSDIYEDDYNIDDIIKKFLSLLFLQMRSIMFSEKDIDSLENKCAQSGPCLYGNLINQFYNKLQNIGKNELTSDFTTLLVEKFRELSKDVNLLVFISKKKNIQVNVSNDMKKNLKEKSVNEKKKQILKGNGSGQSSMFISHCASTNRNKYNDIIKLNRKNGFNTIINTYNENLQSYNENSDYCFFVNKLKKTNVKKSSVNTVNLLNGGRNVVNSPKSMVYEEGVDEEEDNDDVEEICMDDDDDEIDNNESEPLVINNSLSVSRKSSTISKLLLSIPSDRFENLEYFVEILRRVKFNSRVSTKYLKYPGNCDSFISYYNPGNLKKAGFTMNFTYHVKGTLFLQFYNTICFKYLHTMRKVYSKLYFEKYQNEFKNVCVEHNKYVCPECFYILTINDLPFIYKNFFAIDKSLITFFMLYSKKIFSAIQITLNNRNFIQVMITSGILMQPILILDSDTYVDTDTSKDFTWCKNCQIYYPANMEAVKKFSSLYHIVSDSRILYDIENFKNEHLYPFTDGNIPNCNKHIWVSCAEKKYYSQNDDLFNYETSCHGNFVTSSYNNCSKISSRIVSIQAIKRSIIVSNSPCDKNLKFIGELMEQYIRYIIRADLMLNKWYYYDSNDILRLLQNSDIKTLNKPILTKKNTMILNFMFGCIDGENCEDSYVFNSKYIPMMNIINQLKITFSTTDNLIPKLGTYRFIDYTSIINDTDRGFYIILGKIVSFNKLKFTSSSVFINEKNFKSYYVYKLIYFNNNSYFSRDKIKGVVFSNPNILIDKFDELELLINENTNSFIYNNLIELKKNTNSYDILYQSESNSKLIDKYIVVNQKYIKVKLIIKDFEQIMKIQNNSGQKGMVNYKDELDDLVTEDNENIHIIVSDYSILSRWPVAQFLEQKSYAGKFTQFIDLKKVYSKRTKQQVGYCGKGEFFVSKDNPGENFHIKPVKLCNLTYIAAINSNCSTSTFCTVTNVENKSIHPYSFIQNDIQRLLKMFRLYNRDINFKRLSLKNIRSLLYTYEILKQNNINVNLVLNGETIIKDNLSPTPHS